MRRTHAFNGKIGWQETIGLAFAKKGGNKSQNVKFRIIGPENAAPKNVRDNLG